MDRLNEKFTGLKDDNGNEIFIGDKLLSEWGYEVIVYEENGEFLGELICEDDNSCKGIPYSLCEGNGYVKL